MRTTGPLREQGLTVNERYAQYATALEVSGSILVVRLDEHLACCTVGGLQSEIAVLAPEAWNKIDRPSLNPTNDIRDLIDASAAIDSETRQVSTSLLRCTGLFALSTLTNKYHFIISMR